MPDLMRVIVRPWPNTRRGPYLNLNLYRHYSLFHSCVLGEAGTLTPPCIPSPDIARTGGAAAPQQSTPSRKHLVRCSLSCLHPIVSAVQIVRPGSAHVPLHHHTR